MARASMATLISRVRTLVADPAGAEQVFVDDDLQAALDERATRVDQTPLTGRPSIAAGGAVTYRLWYAAEGAWEADRLLQDGTWATLTPTASDDLAGAWTFTAGLPGPLSLTGVSYDLYGAAADLLDAWAAREKLSFTFSTDGQQFTRSQKFSQIAALAETYRRRQRPRLVSLVRTDAW